MATPLLPKRLSPETVAFVFDALEGVFAESSAPRSTKDVLATLSCARSMLDPSYKGPFAHLKGFKFDFDSPEARAQMSWFRTLAKAEEIIRAQGGESLFPPPPPAAVGHEATAAEIIRAGAIRRGEIAELPADPIARAIIKAGSKRRGDPDPGAKTS